MSIEEVVLERLEAVYHQSLGQVVAMSREILKCAEMDDWQHLISLEDERNHLLTEFFQKPVDESEADDVAASIRLIQVLDKKTIQYAESEYKTVSSELKKLNKGRRVSNAYLK